MPICACIAKTTGKQCRLSTIKNSKYCHNHQNCLRPASTETGADEKKSVPVSKPSEKRRPLVLRRKSDSIRQEAEKRLTQETERLVEQTLAGVVRQETERRSRQARQAHQAREKRLTQETESLVEQTLAGAVRQETERRSRQARQAEEKAKTLYPAKQDRSLKLRQEAVGDLVLYRFDDFKVPELKGSESSGTYGIAIPVTHVRTGAKFVLKKYKENWTDHMDEILREIIMIRHLNRYPDTNVVRLYGVLLEGNTVYLVMEPLVEELQQYVWKMPRDARSPQLYQKIFRQLLESYQAIHRLGFVHIDLKPGNIMVDEKQNIRIIDFGLSEFLGIAPTVSQVDEYITTEFVKAPDDKAIKGYMRGNRKTYASDVYSIAASMISLILRDWVKVTRIAGGIFEYERYLTSYNEPIRQAIGSQGFNLLLRMLEPETHNRPCIDECLAHPYFSGMSGGGKRMNEDRLGRDYVGYNATEYRNRNMELCVMEHIHQNYMDIRLPTIDFKSDADHLTFRKASLTILNTWVKTVGNRLLNNFDTVFNAHLLVKDMIARNLGTRERTQIIDAQFICQAVNSYSVASISEYTREYNIPAREIVASITNTAKSYQFNFDFIPVWSQIIYVKLHLMYDRSILRGLVLDMDQIVPMVALNVMFFVAQNKPYQHPITVWELVIYAYITTICQLAKIKPDQYLGNPIAPWLTLPIEQMTQLDQYFSESRHHYNRELSVSTVDNVIRYYHRDRENKGQYKWDPRIFIRS